MKKFFTPTRIVFMVALLSLLLIACQIPQQKVTITQNLEPNGWYWTQFNLPTGGNLMRLDNYDGYKEYRNLMDKPSFAMKRRVAFYRTFYGTFCCAETIPGKYVFLPTDDLNADVTKLVFFAENGDVWVIPVPPSLLTPQNGEVTTTATIYH